MAQGILRHAAGDFVNVQSADSRPAGYVHPRAIPVMKEIGIEIFAEFRRVRDQIKLVLRLMPLACVKGAKPNVALEPASSVS